LLLAAAGVGLVTAVVSLALPSRYQSSTSFTSSSANDLSLGAASITQGLAQAFGVGQLTNAAKSPEFFRAAIDLPRLLEEVLLAQYPYSGDGGSLRYLSLLDIYDLPGATPRRRIEKSISKLSDNINVTVDRLTGIVTLQVTALQPQLAAALADTVLQELNALNLASQQSQAKAQRVFLEGRVGAARDSLRAAERALMQFYTDNRTFAASPPLAFRERQLRRDVDMATQLYLPLSEQLEQARILEVRNTPVLVVLSPAVLAAQRSFPKRTLMVILATVSGLLAATIYVVGSAWWRSGGAHDSRLVDSLDDLRQAFALQYGRIVRR
jgi:uncharacterized protein involved in exopolysaccharide biosynthesis